MKFLRRRFAIPCAGWPIIIGIAPWVASTALARDFLLVQEGRPVATIVIAASPSANARAASFELQRYVRAMSGAELPIVEDAAVPSGPLILVEPAEPNQD